MEITKQMVDEDFMQLKGLAKIGKDIHSPYFCSYDNIYPFTNDRLKDIFKTLDTSNGVLTVTASGDQALMAILNGAPYVKMFDINHLAKYFAIFKFTSISCLSYDEFIRLYKINELFSNYIAGGFLTNPDVKLYNKVCSNMDYVCARFFELLYEFMETATVGEKFNLVNIKYYPKLAGYLTRNDYEELKWKIKNISAFDFIDCSIFNLKQNLGNEIYSAMVFSNISSYFNKSELENYLKLLKSLEENLTNDGLIQAGYGTIKYKPDSIGKNSMNPKFVDDNRNCFFETKSHGMMTTFYKRSK